MSKIYLEVEVSNLVIRGNGQHGSVTIGIAVDDEDLLAAVDQAEEIDE